MGRAALAGCSSCMHKSEPWVSMTDLAGDALFFPKKMHRNHAYSGTRCWWYNILRTAAESYLIPGTSYIYLLAAKLSCNTRGIYRWYHTHHWTWFHLRSKTYLVDSSDTLSNLCIHYKLCIYDTTDEYRGSPLVSIRSRPWKHTGTWYVAYDDVSYHTYQLPVTVSYARTWYVTSSQTIICLLYTSPSPRD